MTAALRDFEAVTEQSSEDLVTPAPTADRPQSSVASLPDAPYSEASAALKVSLGRIAAAARSGSGR
jgi:hypothetical protein